jgi:GT2 family glycosyltransferase
LSGKAVDVVILSWNGVAFLERCLSSLLRQTYSGSRILVVDNASTDGSVSMVRQRFPQVEVVENESNLGFAGGINVGLRHCTRDSAILLNQDTELREDWLESLVHAMESDSAVGVAGCKLLYADGKTLQHAGGVLNYPSAIGAHRGRGELDRGQYDQKPDVDFVTGAALAVRSDVLQEIGLLDEGFFFYYEDADFCFRARQAGYRVIYAPKAVGIHHEGTAVRKLGGEHYCLLHRSRLTFVLKHYSLGQLVEDFIPAEKAFHPTLSRLELDGVCAAYQALLESWASTPGVERFEEEEGDLIRNALTGLRRDMDSQAAEEGTMGEEIEVDALMQGIQETVRQKRERASVQPREEGLGFSAAELAGLTEELREDLSWVQHNPAVWVSLTVSDQPPTRVPLLTRMWGLVRRQAHQLVIFYVNRLAAQQSKLNVRFVKILSRVVERLYGSAIESEIAHLRAEITDLTQRIESLENSVSGTAEGGTTEQ